MTDINKIRNEKLTEDFKMEAIADFLESGHGEINVVELHNMSGTLSDEDYNKVIENNCLIVSSTQYFYKQYSAATVIRYGAIPRLTASKVIFDYVDIDKTTKGYEVKYEELPIGG